MKPRKQQSGFTIIELMMTLALAATVITLAAPAFGDFVANTRLTTTTNDFITAISYARSEAVRRSASVRITAISAQANDEWGAGWQILDEGGNLLRTFDVSSPVVSLNDLNDVSSLTFDSRGFLSGLAGGTTISICDNRDDETGRQLTISPTGRPQLNRQFTGCNS